MNEFDDAELREGLQGLAPDVDTAGALEALRPLASRARSRHRARLAGITTACIVLVGGTAVAVTSTGDDRVSITPATSPAIADATTTTLPQTTTPTTQAGNVPPPSVPTADATTPGATTPDSTPGTTDDTPSSTPTTDDHGGGGGGGGGGNGPDDTAPDSGVKTYSGEGGSIDVRVTDGKLVLVDVRPAAGYAEDKRDVDADGERIRVEFEREDGTHQGQPARVEVRIQNGEVRQTSFGPSS